MGKKNLPPTTIVVFGGTGDLTKRKLVPAFYNLYLGNHMPEHFRVILVGRDEDKDDTYKKELHAAVNEFSRTGKAEEKSWKEFSEQLIYLRGDLVLPGLYSDLKAELAKLEKGYGARGQRLFYMAIPPKYIENVADGLFNSKICNKPAMDRMVVEKPFGSDLATAKKLNAFLQKRFNEKQIFRIDHYLGKETVQNIMAFRFANFIFEPLWNNNFIDHVQISVAEQVSVGSRGGYYDNSGALKDMIQNHLLQLLCVVAMECPKKYEAETIRNSKLAVLKSLRVFKPADVSKYIIRGQYTAATVNGVAQLGYLQEDAVAKNSTTETFVAGKFFVDNKRWKNVPFFLRTGKSLPKQASVIVIQFKESPQKLFKDDITPNRLIISIQPEQEISLLFESKIPGVKMKLKPVEMDFTYKESYTEATPEAYEALLLDVSIVAGCNGRQCYIVHAQRPGRSGMESW
ncbi:MAG: glucose-6-phosphate dehydrogenase [Ferruginibacter sp.]